MWGGGGAFVGAPRRRIKNVRGARGGGLGEIGFRVQGLVGSGGLV